MAITRISQLFCSYGVYVVQGSVQLHGAAEVVQHAPNKRLTVERLGPRVHARQLGLQVENDHLTLEHTKTQFVSTGSNKVQSLAPSTG